MCEGRGRYAGREGSGCGEWIVVIGGSGTCERGGRGGELILSEGFCPEADVGWGRGA